MKSLASLLLNVLALQYFTAVVVDSAHPQRLVNDFLDDGTPIWRYVDLPPLEQVLDPKLEIEESGPNGHRDLQCDHLRILQNGCPSNDDAYTFRFSQEFVVDLYGPEREMNPQEVRTFERIVRETWNDPSNK